jgi:hypothetical protein
MFIFCLYFPTVYAVQNYIIGQNRQKCPSRQLRWAKLWKMLYPLAWLRSHLAGLAHLISHAYEHKLNFICDNKGHAYLT